MWAVEKLAPFAVYQSRCWTRTRCPNADPLLPSSAICGKYASLTEIGRKVVILECFDNSTKKCHAIREFNSKQKREKPASTTKQQTRTLCTGCRACLIPASY